MSLVERLREPDRTYTSDRSGLCVEAADEIERLRAHLKALEAAAHQAKDALEECNRALPVLATVLQSHEVYGELIAREMLLANKLAVVALAAAVRGTGGNE